MNALMDDSSEYVIEEVHDKRAADNFKEWARTSHKNATRVYHIGNNLLENKRSMVLGQLAYKLYEAWVVELFQQKSRDQNGESVYFYIAMRTGRGYRG